MISRNDAVRPTANGRSTWRCCGAPVVDFTYHKCGGRPVAAPTVAHATKAPRVKAGAVHEAKLCAVLDSLGYIDVNNATRATPVGSVYVREYGWGVFLDPPRLFRFDAALPAQRVAVECDGSAHAAGKRKQRTDTERRGLAASIGWRVVAVTPEQIDDGRARDVIRAALGFGEKS